MKLNKKSIWLTVTAMLLSVQSWAESGMTPMEEHNVTEHNATAGQVTMEPAGDADPALQEKNMSEPNMSEPMAMEQSGFSRGSVVRSVFTTAVDEREPTDNIKELSSLSDKVIYYTELRDMSGQTAKHRWEFNGEVMAEVEFNVGGSRWRVWSSKSFVPGWTGEWKVSVLNGANEVISEDILTYTPAPATSEPETLPVVEPPAPIENMPVH